MNAWRFFYKVKSGNYPALVLMLFGFFLLGVFGGSKFEDGWDSAKLSFGLKISIGFIFFGFLLFVKKNHWSLSYFYQVFYPIRWWIFIQIGLILVAFLSLFFCFDVVQTMKVIVKTLVISMFLICLFYVLFQKSSRDEIKNIFMVVATIFFFHCVMTICVYLWSGDSRSIGIENYPIIGYAIFLLSALSIALAMLIYTPYKFLSLCLIAISLFALYANGTRASILSVAAMILCAVFYPKYPYKKLSIALTLCAFVGGGAVLLEWSEKQNARFNFKAMIEKVGIVWSYAPAEMGRFDEVCFDRNSFYRCSIYSGDRLDSRFSFESSALNRLALSKSALTIIMKNPWKPHGYYQQFFNRNIPKDLNPKDYFYAFDENGRFFYNAVHNSFLSAFFEMGLIGGVLYLLEYIALILYGVRQRNFYGFILTLIVGASMIQDAFDVPLSYLGILYVFSSFVGILLGASQNKIIRN